MFKAINPIKAYSIGHLILCLAAILLALVIAGLVKNFQKSRVILAFGIVLALLEAAKQFLLFKIYGAYSWSDFPFQLCSVPMYLCLIYPFARKAQGTIEAFLRSFGILGAVFAFAIPYDVLSEYPILSIHSSLWHMALFSLGAYCISASDIPSNFKKKQRNALLYFFLSLAAITINAALFNVSGGTSNMFFLGPAKPGTLILDDIHDRFGWIAASLTMITASEMGGLLTLTVGDHFINILHRKGE